MSGQSQGPSSAGQCPMCVKPAQAGFLPFCSKRCQMLDLGNWFSEVYAVPSEEPESLPEEKEDD